MANAAELKTTISRAPSHIPAADDSSHPAFIYGMLSHPGRVRHANQDACAAAPEHAAFVVCDGVGGAAGGEIASQLAVETFLSALRSSSTDDRVAHSRAVSSCVSGEESVHPSVRLHQAVLAANALVFQRAQKQRHLRGMATTLVAALLEDPASDAGVPHSYAGVSTRTGGKDDDRSAASPAFTCPILWLAHAGDSRAYRFRSGANADSAELTQLTSDHSLVEEHIRAGIISRLDALRSPVRNVITRAIGAAPTVEPEIASHAIQPGDLYLLASDGLTRELDDAEIARILTASLEGTALDLVAHSRADSSRVSGEEPSSSATLTSATLEASAHALIDAANQHGGRDNITVLLLACR